MHRGVQFLFTVPLCLSPLSAKINSHRTQLQRHTYAPSRSLHVQSYFNLPRQCIPIDFDALTFKLFKECMKTIMETISLLILSGNSTYYHLLHWPTKITTCQNIHAYMKIRQTIQFQCGCRRNRNYHSQDVKRPKIQDEFL